MKYDYETHKGFAKLSADCGDIVANSQDKTIRSLPDRILLCHLRDLLVKSPAQIFPESKSHIIAPTDVTKDLAISAIIKPPSHNN